MPEKEIFSPKKNSPFQLIVEGIDDQFTIINLIDRYHEEENNFGLPQYHINVHVFQEENEGAGLSKVISGIPTYLKGSYDRVGMVVDFDTPEKNRWESVKNALIKAKVLEENDFREGPKKEGTIKKKGTKYLASG